MNITQNKYVIINTNRKGYTQYNGKQGIYKDTIPRDTVNGYINLIEVENRVIKLFDSDFELVDPKQSYSVKDAEEELKIRIANSSKSTRQETLKLLKEEYYKHTGIHQMLIAQVICQIELG